MYIYIYIYICFADWIFLSKFFVTAFVSFSITYTDIHLNEMCYILDLFMKNNPKNYCQLMNLFRFI